MKACVTLVQTRNITLTMTEEEAQQLGSLCLRNIDIPNAVAPDYNKQKVRKLLDAINNALYTANVKISSDNFR